jgi:hypothetical protein
MTDYCHVSCVLKQNECPKMSNNGRWICMFSLSINKCKKVGKKIKQNLNVLLKYNPIRNVKFQNIFKMIMFHLDYQSLIKNLGKMSCFLYHFSLTSFQIFGM